MFKSLLLLASLALLTGCGGVVIPLPADPVQTRSVILLQHARHSSLVLTRADASRVRYAYGDWAWYVEEDEGLLSGARALFWPSPAALGRAELPPAQTGEQLARVIGVGIDHAHLLSASPQAVDALLARLEQTYATRAAEPHYSATRALAFVPHAQPYHLWHNSNHVVAGWLRALGMQVRGSPLFGVWRVAAGE